MNPEKKQYYKKIINNIKIKNKIASISCPSKPYFVPFPSYILAVCAWPLFYKIDKIVIVLVMPTKLSHFLF